MSCWVELFGQQLVNLAGQRDQKAPSTCWKHVALPNLADNR